MYVDSSYKQIFSIDNFNMTYFFLSLSLLHLQSPNSSKFKLVQESMPNGYRYDVRCFSLAGINENLNNNLVREK
jgi:hypothetical protein